MRIIIQKTRRVNTENGYVFNEDPEIIEVCHRFPGMTKSQKGCSCPGVTGHFHKLHVATLPFGKYYSACDVKMNPCIPNNVLRYKEGRYTEIHRSCEECK